MAEPHLRHCPRWAPSFNVHCAQSDQDHNARITTGCGNPIIFLVCYRLVLEGRWKSLVRTDQADRLSQVTWKNDKALQERPSGCERNCLENRCFYIFTARKVKLPSYKCSPLSGTKTPSKRTLAKSIPSRLPGCGHSAFKVFSLPRRPTLTFWVRSGAPQILGGCQAGEHGALCLLHLLHQQPHHDVRRRLQKLLFLGEWQGKNKTSGPETFFTTGWRICWQCK